MAIQVDAIKKIKKIKKQSVILGVLLCSLGISHSASAKKTLVPRSFTGWRWYRKAPVRLTFERHRGRVTSAKLTIDPGRQKHPFLLRIIRGSTGKATIPKKYSPKDGRQVVSIKDLKPRERITVQQQDPTGRVKAVNYYFIPRNALWRRIGDFFAGK